MSGPLRKRVRGVIFVGLVLVACVANLLVLSVNQAQAVPPKTDWVEYWPVGLHCETVKEPHCWPGSAWSF
jgi:hypothetical protein